MDPGVTWGIGRVCTLVVHHWADLQSVHGFRCYDNIRKMSASACTAWLGDCDMLAERVK